MHFHLPKPLHGWREFAGEVGIIVIGVLIALSAEQVVEAIHWRHEVQVERSSLMAEAAGVLAAVKHRQDDQPCVARRLAELRMVLVHHSRGEPLGIVASVGQPTRMAGALGSWQIALAGQALAHMPHDEKLRFSEAFDSYARWNGLISAEQDVWARLAPLAEPDLLTDAAWTSLVEAYWQAVQLDERIALAARFNLKFENLGLKTKSVPASGGYERLEAQFCAPMLAGAHRT